MRNKFLILFAISSMLLALSSCKQNKTPLALYIPKDASVIVEVDTKTITDKIKSSGITLDSLANTFDKNRNGMHWSDIENSGIDLSKSFFIFSNENSSMQNGNTKSTGLVIAISDKNKLQAFLQKQVAGATVKPDNKYQYLDLGDGGIAGWNDDVLIISNVNSTENLSHQQLTTLFTQSESNSIASVDGFDKMLAKTGDIHFWSNASNSFNKIPMAAMTKIGTLFQDTYTEGTIDFKNGKAVASFESHLNKTIADIINKYPSKTIDKSMVANYPNPVNGFGIVAFNPKVIIDILRYLGFDSMADGYASNLGFTTADVVNAFSGDIAIIYSNFKMDDNGEPMPGMPMNKPGGEFLANLKIGDKNAFDKVMNGLVSKNILSKNGNQYQLGMHGGHEFIMEVVNNNLIIGSGDALIKTYTGNNKSNLPADAEKIINNKSAAVYVDVSNLLKNMNTSDSSGMQIMQMAQSTFKNFIYTTDKSNGKTFTGNATLNLQNSNDNSLASIVKFMALVHQQQMLNKKETMYPPMSALPDSLSHEPASPDDDSD